MAISREATDLEVAGKMEADLGEDQMSKSSTETMKMKTKTALVLLSMTSLQTKSARRLVKEISLSARSEGGLSAVEDARVPAVDEICRRPAL